MEFRLIKEIGEKEKGFRLIGYRSWWRSRIIENITRVSEMERQEVMASEYGTLNGCYTGIKITCYGNSWYMTMGKMSD